MGRRRARRRRRRTGRRGRSPEPGARRDDATRACLRPAASRFGRAWASRTAAPAASAAAALEPLIVPYLAVPSSFRPGSAVARPMPAALTSGLRLPSKASPSDENGAASPSPVLLSNAAAPTARVTGTARRTAARTAWASAAANPRTGTSTGPSVPSDPAGRGPSTRTARAPASTTSRTASGEDVPRGRSAAAPATRLNPALSKRRLSPPAPPTTAGPARARTTTGAGHRDRRRHDTAERLKAGDEHPEPGEEQNVARRRAASRVDRSGGEGRGCSTRPADAAVRRARRPVVPGRRHDKRIECRGSGRGNGEGAVGKRGERLDDPDERHPDRVVRVTVFVRIDRQLDSREELIRPAVDGNATRGVRLPAGNPDREQRRARCDTGEPGRAVRADDEPGHLGAVALGPVRSGRILPRTRVPTRVDHVEPRQERPSDVRMDDVDPRIEQRNRHAGAREPGNADVDSPPTGGADEIVEAARHRPRGNRGPDRETRPAHRDRASRSRAPGHRATWQTR